MLAIRFEKNIIQEILTMKKKILGLGIILVMISMCGCGADEGSVSEPSIKKDDEMPTEIGAVESASEDGKKENYKTPRDYIFSGDTENYLTYVYVKDTEVITASRYDFMGEGTDLLDITFTSHNKDYEDDGTEPDTDLWVRRSSFNEDSCTVTIHDWDYNNSDEPITVSFSDDMSQIDVTATWKADVTNEQAIFNGHYELQGTYTVDEMSEYFWVDGERNFENVIDANGYEGTGSEDSNEMETQDYEGDYLFDIWTLAGEYEGEDVTPPSNMSVSIYSSPEDDIVGNYIITIPNSGIEYTGELRRDSDKTFSLVSNGEVYAVIEVEDETLGAVVIHYVEDGFECNYRMYEAYPMP